MDLKVLCTKKRVGKSSLTKLKDKIVDNCESADDAQLQLFKTKLKLLEDELTEIFGNIFIIVKEEEIDTFIEESQTVQDTIDELFLLIARATTKLINDSNSNVSSVSQGKKGSEIKLPKLSLPIFSGNLEDWISFSDLFRASITNNDKLSGAQKLSYLKCSLKSDALKIVQSLPICDNNFDIAWELLSQRFSHKRELVSSLVSKLLCLPSLIGENSSHILNLVDSTREYIRSLETLDQKLEKFSDTLLMFLVQSKLDPATRSWWERSLNGDDIPTLNDLFEFLKNHARTLQPSKVQSHKKQAPSRFTSLSSELKFQCILCKGNHVLNKCNNFMNLSVQKRFNVVKDNNICFNCLVSNHRVSSCKSVHKCRKCKRKHHTLLHFDRGENNYESSDKLVNNSRVFSADTKVFVPQSPSSNNPKCSTHKVVNMESENATIENSLPNITSCLSDFNLNQQVLLCTAIIRVLDSSGEYQLCRALLDPGSQASFITNDCIHRLGLSRQKARVLISCLGSADAHTNGVSEIKFMPHFSSKSFFSTAVFVINKIIGELPHCSLDPACAEHFNDLTLADPTFYKSAPIDILLGVNISLPMLKGETIKSGEEMPFAVRSELGWIVSGSVTMPLEETPTIHVNNIHLETERLVSNFWELDSVPVANLMTDAEQACENHYKATHSRDENGKYIVKLPFHSTPAQLGDSSQLAMRRFKCLEKSLSTKPEVYKQYREFMHDYQDLGHMEKITKSEYYEKSTFYMPHHAVFKESSTTTKLRVVFDASAKTTTGLSLNDLLMVGPRVQQELFPILIRFRTFPVAVCADVEKMFRQIKVHPEDTNWQRVLWRNDPNGPVETYRLLTVTYGTSCAPFLSTRTMKQLALDEKDEFPLASEVTLRDFYVDDLLSGAQTEDEACQLTKQMSEMMVKGGFTLRKWISNIPSVLEGIPENLRESSISLRIDSDNTIKVLGINWIPTSDNFHFSVCAKNKETFTKRTILSEIAKIFDPLGWLAPTVIFAKIFLQELWNYKLDWDEIISETLSQKWKSFYSELQLLSSFKIPRYVLVSKPLNIQIHSFCDASEKAYCAVIYLRSVASDSSIKVSLLTAKTRVAPIKKQSLPRLELCAAVLLANLLEAVSSYLTIPINKSYAWSDSRVALAWISSESRRWQPFVANRVARIQEAIPDVKWNHVSGLENPADCGTRGLLPHEFIRCDLWTNGPHWLRQPFEEQTMEQTSNKDFIPTEILKKEEKISYVSTVTQLQTDHFIFKFSSWTKLCRVTAWCLRFVNNCSKLPSERIKSHLSWDELDTAITKIVKIVQQSDFHEELTYLRSGKTLKSSSKILSLTPFVDDLGIMRVGGRLRNAKISEDQKHPMILPKNHHITELIIKYFHEKHLHGGPQLLLAVIRQRFWIISARDAIRKCLHHCVICCRHRAQTSSQLMADLPATRVTQCRAFGRVGVDFTGPFNIKTRSGRGAKTTKCYVCLFVCFTTRAIHLEVVGDLSTKSFLATLKRFIARRGKPSEIHSDCGTNFIGAAKELKKYITSFKDDDQLHGYLTSEHIKWLFNPPSAPHFGGLWEAGVKSMKYHLKRTLGTSTLTYEEFLTLITQIEACLNSRPLVPASSDPNDLSVLTPGHFLIGTALSALPESDLIQEKLNHLDRWRVTQRMFQQFWKRWSAEYLSRLQQRPKWCKPQRDFQPGDLVLVKNENLPPLRWRIGKIIKIYPGKDNKVRVVDLRTSAGELKRPIAKLCALPCN